MEHVFVGCRGWDRGAEGCVCTAVLSRAGVGQSQTSP